ncbi:MAG: phosphate/phosphite/phosphonate ABC transporter substrate-binding protein [Nitrospiraceae bacterium]|nr:MAG: phosphate/phosphite/phosphonate ABC transporter substrate-binding protein [Nitrospiraceae bacterium]
MRFRFIIGLSIILWSVILPLQKPAHHGPALYAESKSGTPKQPIKIGVASMITPVDTVKYYQDIIDYVGEQINQPVQMVQRRTYDEMDSLLEKGEVKVAFLCSSSYVMDNRNFGAELLVAPRLNGKATYNSYVIVHKDSTVKSFPELKNNVFAFTDPKSNSGKLYPTYLLKTMGYTPERFFKRTIYSYSHNKSVELVAKRVVDGAAVESMVYEYMIKKNSPYARQTRIIKRSPPFGIPPVVVGSGIDAGLKKKIRDAFLNMHKTEKGMEILNAMMIEGFMQISDSAYDSIRKMEQYVAGSGSNDKKDKGRQTIHFGVIPRDNPRIMYEKYQPLLDYLSEKTPYGYELVLKKNYEDTVNAIGSGMIDVALFGPLTYLEARARYGIVCLLKPKGIDGTATYKSVVITNKKSSNIYRLSELKGKTIAFSASKSTSGNLMPRYLLANAGIHLSELSKYANFDYHDSAVKAVLKGQYDAGAVRDSIAKKYMKLGLDVIATSDAIPTGPLVVSKRLAAPVVAEIKKALLDLNPNDPHHQKVLKRLDDDLKNGFIEAFDSDYAGIRTKINAVPETCGIRCHPRIRL